jgi:hypothetical protein
MNGDTDRWSFLIGGMAIVAVTAIIFVGYNIRHRDERAAQAADFAKIFIQSSPVVERQLGEVRAVKEVEEQHHTGKAVGWFLNYDVTGERRTGTVEMLLTPNPNYGQWNVPMAKLEMDHIKPVNLR